MSDLVLFGPFWTRAQAADYVGVSADELASRPDVLKLEGRWLEETYPALQFHDHTIRYDVAAVVEVLGDQLPGEAIADWLTRPNLALGSLTPMQWFDSGQDVEAALRVAVADIAVAAARMETSAVAAAG